MSILADFNEYAGLLLDGRFDGILGNTIGQSTFGTAYSVNVGNSNEFNIDWQNQWLIKQSLIFPSISPLYTSIIPTIQAICAMLPSPKNVGGAGGMKSGFFSFTVGNSFELTAGGELWDLSRGVDKKTEFALDDGALYSALTGNEATFTPEQQAALSLVPSITFEILFNLFVTTYSQVASFYSGLTSEDNSEGAEVAQAVLTGLNLLLYLFVPVINSNLSLVVYTIEKDYADLFEKLTQEWKDAAEKASEKARLVGLEAKAQTLEDSLAQQETVIENIVSSQDELAKTQLNDLKWKDASTRYQFALAKWKENWDKWEFKKNEAARKQSKWDSGGFFYQTRKGARPANFTDPQPVAPIWREFFDTTLAPKYEVPFT